MHAEDAYLFRHALLRDAAYQLQLPGDRAKLHALALEAIETVFGRPGDPDSLAHCASELADHAHAAGVAEHPDVRKFEQLEWTYCTQAANWALKHYEFREAAGFFSRVARLSSVPTLDAGIAQRSAAEALRNAGDLRESLERAQSSLELCRQSGDSEAAFRSRLFKAKVLRNLGERKQAQAEYQALLESAPAKFRWLVLDGAGSMETESGNAAKGAELLQQALSAYAQVPGDSASNVIRANLASAMARLGRWQEAEAQFEASYNEFQALGQQFQAAVSLSNLAQIRKSLGRIEIAQQNYISSIALLTSTGNRRHLARTLVNYANLLADLGRRAEARSSLYESLQLVREMGERILELNTVGNLAMMDLDDGFFLRALASLRLCCDEFSALGLSDMSGTFLSELARFTLLVHGPSAADPWYARAALHANGASVRAERFLPARHVFELAAAARGSADALSQAQRTLTEMTQLALELGAQPSSFVSQSIEICRLRQTEAERALAEKRPAMLLEGMRPLELTAAFRAAWLDRLRTDRPEERNSLLVENPALLEELSRGLEAEPVVNWRDDRVP